MSFLKKLFGIGASEPKPGPVHEAVEYKGYVIRPEPFEQQSQFQTAGRITKDLDGTERVHTFVRADKHGSLEDAVAFSVTKAKLIIDQQGDRIFDEPPKSVPPTTKSL
jgi:hypothetical protein